VVILVVFLLVFFSAICSGLNIALMSLNVADLRRKTKLGDTDARSVLPLRQNSHLTLAAILLSNVAAASATALVLGDNFNGWIAILLSTLLLVTFGEIMPQAIFARNALHFCARLAPLMHFMVFITYPVSKPLQFLLDSMLGPETTELHTRHELGIMITEHLGENESELDEDEVEIIRGALKLSEKRVQGIMTPIRNVFWLTPQDTLDSDAIKEIKSHGWSRIPVFNKQHTTCFGLLLMKDLVDVKFTNKVTVEDLNLYPTQVVGSMTALDTMFRKFITGGAHLIPVEKDDEIVGIVTIEDLLEEIVGHEIEDETDRSRRKKIRRRD
jgi:metal transporter CNNM